MAVLIVRKTVIKTIITLAAFFISLPPNQKIRFVKLNEN
jgi:hypothetical protein